MQSAITGRIPDGGDWGVSVGYGVGTVCFKVGCLVGVTEVGAVVISTMGVSETVETADGAVRRTLSIYPCA